MRIVLTLYCEVSCCMSSFHWLPYNGFLQICLFDLFNCTVVGKAVKKYWKDSVSGVDDAFLMNHSWHRTMESTIDGNKKIPEVMSAVLRVSCNDDFNLNSKEDRFAENSILVLSIQTFHIFTITLAAVNVSSFLCAWFSGYWAFNNHHIPNEYIGVRNRLDHEYSNYSDILQSYSHRYS